MHLVEILALVLTVVAAYLAFSYLILPRRRDRIARADAQQQYSKENFD